MNSQNSQNQSLEPKHIAEELYKKNLELAERNKTLSLLRKIDEIILSSVTDIEEVVRQVAQAVVAEAGFKAVYIYILKKREKLLKPLGIALSKTIAEVDPNLQRAMYSVKISMNNTNNLIVKAVKEKKMQESNNLHLLFESYLTKEATEEIQGKLLMNFFQIHPLIVREESIGAIIISPKEEKEPFFLYQSDLIERLPQVVSIAIDNSLLYEKIEHANIRLKELDKLKDEFVSIASHELRTPMTAIKSYLWLSLNKSPQNLDPSVKSNLQISLQETERLIKLVQNLLTISRIESKRLELNIEPVNIFDLTKQVYDGIKIKADEKKVHFTLAPYPEKLIVNGDKEKLAEVFENIIGNALKYSPERGKVFVSFSVEQDKVAIHISDTGPGISKENMPKLFKKFARLEETKENRTPGTGLGLYITKQIVTLHKGTIIVESEVGKGTTFTVHLPLA